MFSIKFYRRFCEIFVLLLWSAIIWQGWALAQEPVNVRPLSGDITIENIFPGAEPVIVRIDRAQLSTETAQIQGEVFIGKEENKTADIYMIFNATKTEKEKKLDMVLDNINPKNINALLPFLPPILSDSGDYQITLSFNVRDDNGKNQITPISFTLQSESLALSGELTMNDDLKSIKDLKIDIAELKIDALQPLAAEFLQSQDAQLNGSLKGYANLNPKNNNIINWELYTDEITLASQTAFPEIQTVKNINIRATYDINNQTINIKNAKLQIRNAKFKANAKITFRSQQTIDFTANINMIDGIYNIDELAKDWPTTIAQKPRTWVMENIIKAKVNNIKLNIQGQIKNQTTEIYNLNCHIQIVNGQFIYIKNMPIAKIKQAALHFTPESLTITTKSLAVQNMQNIKAALHITLPEHYNDDNIATANIKINQKFNAVAKLLNAPPAELFSKINLPKKFSVENINGYAKLQFPLINDLTLEDVQFNIDGTLNNFHMPETPFAQELNAKAEQLNIHGDNNAIQISGDTININNIPANIKWIIPLQDTLPFTSQYEIKLTTQDTKIENLPFIKQTFQNQNNFENYLNGEVSAHIIAQNLPNETDTLKIIADLTDSQISINSLNLHKPPEKRGILEVEAMIKQDSEQRTIWHIEQFNYRDKENYIDLAAEINPQSHYPLHSLDLARLRTAGSDLSATVKTEKTQNDDIAYRININAEKLDLIHLFGYSLDALPQQDTETPKSEPQQNTQQDFGQDSNSPNFSVILAAKELFEDEGESPIRNLNLTTRYHNGRVEALNIAAQIGDNTGYINYNANETQKRLLGFIPNFGDVLHYTGLSQRMQGGEMNIEATANKSENPLIGYVSVTDFHLKQAPLLSKLLQIVSAVDALEAFSTDGIHFSKWENNITYKDNLLTITDGALRGTSVGLSMEGTLNTETILLNVQGTVVPLYWVSNIPIIGGGDNIDNAFFGFRYAADGHAADPNVAVNPLSVIAPWSSKKIFNIDPHSPSSETREQTDNR